MRSSVRRAAVMAGTVVVLLGPAAGVAIAGGAPVLGWAPTTSPGIYGYGTVTAGQKVSHAFTLTNSGGSATGALTITLAGSSAFTKTSDTCTTVSTGPGKSCSVTVTYAPATPGETDKATLTAASKKPAATAALTLTGAAAKDSPALTTSPGAGGTVGTAVTDTATLSGGYNPTGTIEFKLYGPSNAAGCSSTPVDDEKVTVTGAGSYATASEFTPAKAGTYWWTASYSGDASNNAVASGCDQESVTVSPAPVVMSTAPSAGPLGGKGEVTDTATLSGGYNPTGTIEFKLYGPSTTADCSGPPLDDETATVSGNGTYGTQAGYGPTQAGTYWWTASYSGDAGNNSATAGCGTESVTVSPDSPAITTHPAPASATVGTTVQDTAVLSGGYFPTGFIYFSLFGPFLAGATPDCSGPQAAVEIVPVNGNGSYTTTLGQTPTQPGTYYWTADYGGDTNNNGTFTGCGDEPVVISPASPAITTTPTPASATVGTTVQDTAALSGGYFPTGFISFALFGPFAAGATPDCSGPEAAVENVTVNGNGSYTTALGQTPTQPGTYYWTASYSGDANNNGTFTGCGDEPVTVTPASPAIATSPQPASATVGSPVADQATVTGGDNPTGTVTFNLYNNGVCSGPPEFTDTETLAGGTATSMPHYVFTAGFYYWVATYNGDTSNSPVTSACNGEFVIINKFSATISSAPSPSTAVVGTQVTLEDSAVVNGFGPSGTISFYLFDPNGNLIDSVPELLLNIPDALAEYTFTPTIPGQYTWEADYGGDVNNLPAHGAPETVTVTAS